jgi:hypothetical protein
VLVFFAKHVYWGELFVSGQQMFTWDWGRGSRMEGNVFLLVFLRFSSNSIAPAVCVREVLNKFLERWQFCELRGLCLSRSMCILTTTIAAFCICEHP